MKSLFAILIAVALSGCGAEVATTAAPSARIKKDEAEAAQQTKAMMQKKIDAATQAIQQGADQAGSVDK